MNKIIGKHSLYINTLATWQAQRLGMLLDALRGVRLFDVERASLILLKKCGPGALAVRFGSPAALRRASSTTWAAMEGLLVTEPLTLDVLITLRRRSSPHDFCPSDRPQPRKSWKSSKFVPSLPHNRKIGGSTLVWQLPPRI